MLCSPPLHHLSYTLYKFETQEDLWTGGLNAVYVVGWGGGGAGHVLFKKAPHTSVCLHNDCSSVGIAPDYVIVAAY